MWFYRRLDYFGAFESKAIALYVWEGLHLRGEVIHYEKQAVWSLCSKIMLLWNSLQYNLLTCKSTRFVSCDFLSYLPLFLIGPGMNI